MPLNNTTPLRVWKIDPLPDFLADPSLTGESEPQRLDEYIARWVQLIAGLSSWADEATFSLRYVAHDGKIDVYMATVAHDGREATRLETEWEVLLRTHRLLADPQQARVDPSQFLDASRLPRMQLVRVRQQTTEALWQPQAEAKVSLDSLRHTLPPHVTEKPWVVFPWAGPSGPFLAPMESLLAQAGPCSLTVLLQPTQLQPRERLWLSGMAQCAQTSAEQNLHLTTTPAPVRLADPSAALAARLYSDSLSRLTGAPFLATAYCAAAADRLEAALSLAGTLRSLVHTPLTKARGEAEQPLPSGAEVMVVDPADARENWQHEQLRFAPAPENDLSRFADLVDARGAATLFRLPVSVRGGVPGIRVRQQPPDFHPGPRQSVPPPDQPYLELGDYHAGGKAFIPVQDLRRHALVTGFTGSGKTKTMLQWLTQLWLDKNVPFLVLETVKTEYRGLTCVKGMAAKQPHLRVYTLGNETVAPFRLNPFQLLPGVRVEAHLSKLQTCFEAAIPPVGPSSSVIAEALQRVYRRAGWSLTDVYPRSGRARRRFPQLSDFVREVKAVLEDRGYAPELKSNLQAALVGRFRPLTFGSKGLMFDCQESAPSAAELFSIPAVLELNDLDPNDRALVSMFLLTLLREHRELDADPFGLKHVTVVEEAHTVLAETPSVGTGEGVAAADTRYQAVQAFCSLLMEVRGWGEGLFIVDQSASKLARDVLRNTNLQLAHQIRDGGDREAVARAMIMELEQLEFVGKLAPGRAAVFFSDLEKATFLTVFPFCPEGPPTPGMNYRGLGYDPQMSNEALRDYMDQVDTTLPERRRPVKPFLACEECGLVRAADCYRDALFPPSEQPEVRAEARAWFQRGLEEGTSADQTWSEGLRLALSLLRRAGLPLSKEALWCTLAHLWSRQLVDLAEAQTEDRPEAEGRDPFATEAWAGLDVDCRKLFDKYWPHAQRMWQERK